MRNRDIAVRSLRLEVLSQAFAAYRESEGDDFDAGRSTHGAFGYCGSSWSGVRPALEQWIADRQTAMEGIVTGLLACSDLVGEVEPLLEYVLDGTLIDEVESVALSFGDHLELSTQLAESGLLPMYGMPTRQRLLYTDRPQDLARSDEVSIDRDSEIAISEFAPGGSLVRDGRRYTPTGVVEYEPGGGGRPVPVGNPLGERTGVGLCSACWHAQLGPDPDSVSCPECGDSSWLITDMAEPLGYRSQYRDAADYDGNAAWTSGAGMPRMVVEMMDDGPAIENTLSRGGKVQLVALNAGVDNEGFLFGSSSWSHWEGLNTQEALDIAQSYLPNMRVPKLDPPFDRVAIGSRKVTDALLLNLIDRPRGVELHPGRTEAGCLALSRLSRKRSRLANTRGRARRSSCRIPSNTNRGRRCRRDLHHRHTSERRRLRSLFP